jgi:hypothetical protein
MAYLGPMVRVASRRGVGQPALLRWLRQQLGDERGGSRPSESGDSGLCRPGEHTLPERETDELVRTLARLLTAPECRVSPVAETVLGV